MTVSSGKVGWDSGPWPDGQHSDVRIFQNGLRKLLGAYEHVVGDSGYQDSRVMTPLPSQHPIARTYSVTRARHETINVRLKTFSVLSKNSVTT